MITWDRQGRQTVTPLAARRQRRGKSTARETESQECHARLELTLCVCVQECDREGVPRGTWKISFQKKEIDGAGQDKKNVRFDDDFSIDYFFQELEGQVPAP